MQVDILEGQVRIVREGAFLMSAAISEHGSQFFETEVDISSAWVALHSIEPQHQYMTSS